MIVGIAQVVLNVEDMADAEHRFISVGCRRTFEQLEIPCRSEKEPFLSGPRDALDMVHLTGPDGQAVELTAYHGGPPRGAAAYRLREHHGGGASRAVEAFVIDEDASIDFWTRDLGFRAGDSGDDGVVLQPLAPHPALRTPVVLVADGVHREETTIDADGCVLVTVSVTDLASDLARLRSSGHVLRFTAPWRERIAGRDLGVALVEGPSGELIELLETPWRR